MTAHEDEQLVRALIHGGETYSVEFKSSWMYGPDGKSPRDIKHVAKDIGEALVAFANTDGGDLLVGVEDSGEITGVPWTGDKLRYLEQAPNQQVPGIDLGASVQRLSIDGQTVLLFRVSDYPSEAVVTADGRCLWRRGAPARSEPIPPREVQRRRTHRLGDTAYESQPVHEATLDDIEIPRGLLVNRPSLRDMKLPGLLRYWNLAEGRNGNTVLRRAALLLFARDPLRWHPNNRVRIIRVLGMTVGHGSRLNTRQTEVSGPIITALDKVRRMLFPELEVESRQANLFTTVQSLPRDAVDECIVNALAHRNYAVEGSATEVMLYPNRVEFRSPGKLPEPLTVKDLKSRQGAHRSRNPLIMRVLRDLGWTRDQGEGMRRIFSSMAQVELNEPELEEVADTFVVRLSTVSRFDPQTQAWLAAYGPFGLLPSERKYVVALQDEGGMRSVDKLARKLGEPFDRTRDALASLEEKCLVWHRPHGRSYRLVQPLDVPHERAFRALTEIGLTFAESTIVTREILRGLPGYTDEESLSSTIERLRQSGILTPGGSGKWKLGGSFLEYLARRGA